MQHAIELVGAAGSFFTSGGSGPRPKPKHCILVALADSRDTHSAAVALGLKLFDKPINFSSQDVENCEDVVWFKVPASMQGGELAPILAALTGRKERATSKDLGMLELDVDELEELDVPKLVATIEQHYEDVMRVSGIPDLVNNVKRATKLLEESQQHTAATRSNKKAEKMADATQGKGQEGRAEGSDKRTAKQVVSPVRPAKIPRITPSRGDNNQEGKDQSPGQDKHHVGRPANALHTSFQPASPGAGPSGITRYTPAGVLDYLNTTLMAGVPGADLAIMLENLIDASTTAPTMVLASVSGAIQRLVHRVGFLSSVITIIMVVPKEAVNIEVATFLHGLSKCLMLVRVGAQPNKQYMLGPAGVSTAEQLHDAMSSMAARGGGTLLGYF